MSNFKKNLMELKLEQASSNGAKKLCKWIFIATMTQVIMAVKFYSNFRTCVSEMRNYEKNVPTRKPLY